MFDRFWGRGNNLPATREATAYLFDNFLYLGLRESHKWKQLHKLYAVLMNFLVLVWLPIAFTLSYYYEFSKMSTVQLLTSLQVSINVCVTLLKSLTMVVSLKHLRQAMEVMDSLDTRCHRKEEREQIRLCAMMGNRLTVFFVATYGLFAAVTMITSVFMGQPPYSFYTPAIDWRNSRLEFAIQFFIEFVLINKACIHHACGDVYAVIYIYIIRTHMQILVARVRRLGTDFDTSNDEHYEQLVLCVKDHQHLLRLLDIISPVISITMFIQFMITAAILGTTLINMFIFADTSTQISSASYFIAVLVQSCPCCYQATCLMHDSEQLSLAIFHCEWFDKDVRFRKMMIFFMLRSQTPITLTALKFFPITLDTSLGIAKFSFSLYTLIKEMDFGQNLKN